MRIVHFCAGLQFWNGMANTAREFVAEQSTQGYDSSLTDDAHVLSKARRGDIDVVYIHGAWLPVLWKVAKHAKRINAKLIIRPAGSYDPVRLAFHRWKKQLVVAFEKKMLRRADVLLATCKEEAMWIKDYVGKNCPMIEITDLKRFFLSDFCISEHGIEGSAFSVERLLSDNFKHHTPNSKLKVLYLGRRHPLKGVEYLERAVKELNHGIHGTHGKGEDSLEFRVESLELGVSEENSKLETRNLELKIVSNAFGEEKERVWEWCDVLVLPTLSENFGRVVAEGLARGKRVITTDGAPAWACIGDCGQSSFVSGDEFRVQSLAGEESNGSLTYGYGGRLIYLRGYRDGTKEQRVELLKKAIEVFRR